MDLSTSQTRSGIVGFAYDPSAELLYFSAGGWIYRWSPFTQQYLSPINVGGQLGDLDIAPDGSYLLVAQHTAGASTGTVERILLADLSIAHLSYPLAFFEGGSADVVIVGQNTALMTTDFGGSGWTPFRQFDASAATLSSVTVSGLSEVRQSSFLLADEDNRFVFVLENNISNAPMHLYDVVAGRIVASTDFYDLGSSGFNTGHADISAAAQLVVNSTYTQLYVLDYNLSLVRDLSSLAQAGTTVGVQFTQSGNHLLIWNSQDDRIHAFDTHTWAEVGSLAVATNVGFAYNGAPWGLMEVVADGRLLILQTPIGFDVIDLEARFSLTLLGGALNDSLFGDVGNDYFYAYGGGDTARGDRGFDVFIMGDGGDTVFGGDGQDYVYGEAGNDALNGDNGVDVLLGGEGDDTMFGGAEGDFFYGENGADIASGEAGNDIFVMAADADTASGGLGQDYFYMGDGNDTLNGGDGVDVMLGEAGDDTFNPGLGVDYAFMGAGNDRLNIDKALSGVTVLNDFTAGAASGDLINLTGTDWTSFTQVQQAISDFTASGGFCILTLDADTSIWFIGVTPAQLTAGDFVFGGG